MFFHLRIRLRPRILRDVSVSDTRTTIQGTEISFPVGIAPTAFHCLAWHEGEMATARGENPHRTELTSMLKQPPRTHEIPVFPDNSTATEALNTCYITSTYSTCSVEEIVAAAPSGYRWFQLYLYRDRKLSEQIVHRVEALGYKALVLTVDVPYTGKRRNDIRNQFKLPPHLKVKNFDGVFQVRLLSARPHPSQVLHPSLRY